MPRKLSDPWKNGYLMIFSFVLAAEMTPHALWNNSSTSPFRRKQVIKLSREYLLF